MARRPRRKSDGGGWGLDLAEALDQVNDRLTSYLKQLRTLSKAESAYGMASHAGGRG
jgi:hypothetical protein